MPHTKKHRKGQGTAQGRPHTRKQLSHLAAHELCDVTVNVDEAHKLSQAVKHWGDACTVPKRLSCKGSAVVKSSQSSGFTLPESKGPHLRHRGANNLFGRPSNICVVLIHCMAVHLAQRRPAGQ